MLLSLGDQYQITPQFWKPSPEKGTKQGEQTSEGSSRAGVGKTPNDGGAGQKQSSHLPRVRKECEGAGINLPSLEFVSRLILKDVLFANCSALSHACLAG